MYKNRPPLYVKIYFCITQFPFVKYKNREDSITALFLYIKINLHLLCLNLPVFLSLCANASASSAGGVFFKMYLVESSGDVATTTITTTNGSNNEKIYEYVNCTTAGRAKPIAIT